MRCQLQKSSKNRPGSSGRLATSARSLGAARFFSIAASASDTSASENAASDAHCAVATERLCHGMVDQPLCRHRASVDRREDHGVDLLSAIAVRNPCSERRSVECGTRVDPWPRPWTALPPGRTTQPANRAATRTRGTSNRTLCRPRQSVGELEGGRALLYPAGMGAVTGIVLTMLQPGGTIALAAGSYYGHKRLLDHLRPWGIVVEEYDQTGAPPAGADLILVEAPSNPMLTMPDFDEAAAHPAPVVCDATLSSPLRLRPLELGCDVSLHSATKVLAGHDDLLAGVACVKDDELYDRLHLTRRLAGLVASADTAWLLERGLKTLEVRLDRMEATATVLAERLDAHPDVVVVRYPGFGFLISFDVVDGEAARRVEIATTAIENATSLGGTRTKLESRHRWEGERCPEGLLRLSVGLESPEVLWADLERALETV